MANTTTKLFGAICTVLLSTCCMVQSLPYGRAAYPAAYFDEVPVGPLRAPMNPWEEALEEAVMLEDAAEDQYQPEAAWMDVDLDALTDDDDDYFGAQPRFEIPVFGQINYGEPAEEELRALKRSAHSPHAANAFQASRVSTFPPPTVKHFLNQEDSSSRNGQFPASIRGQKEVAMLRPPTKAKSSRATTTVATTTTTTQAPSTEPAAHQITSGERQKKPSPYDTLRKYLSIEDAMKKEAEKRMSLSRFQKRSGSSSIIAQEQSLTSQLRGLKKHVA